MTNLPALHMSSLCNRITAVVPPPQKLSQGSLKRQALVKGLGESSDSHTSGFQGQHGNCTLGFWGQTCTVIILRFRGSDSHGNSTLRFQGQTCMVIIL